MKREEAKKVTRRLDIMHYTAEVIEAAHELKEAADSFEEALDVALSDVPEPLREEVMVAVNFRLTRAGSVI